ncbi:YtxH domain-containing protein [Pedobacter psychrodurus]|uniref:YtxH domain-containing protein n=1 Tax=Pedobacter psychrodurus TaxID=2530456 RepID=A0A4R0PML2_9SPHI|nr:YtxH domain-containing protein [Pedobacter psychrodurus]TCD22062.1 YtxH domain-containing protein [Pedobacter psychrodurus]
MGLLKYAILGAAAIYGFKYVTKKRAVDGKSLIDDLKEKAPGYVDKINNYSEKIRQDYRQTSDLY